MISEVSKNLYVGDIDACHEKGSAIIHCCKHPCFERAAGKHHYLSLEVGNDLYINMVDACEPLFCKEIFDVALEFIENNIKERHLVIHCNQGRSRAPSIAMLYLFRNLPYREAQNQMLDIYNDYYPSMGIDLWLGFNWGLFQIEK